MMKSLHVMLAGIAFAFFAGSCRAQEEPVKPAEPEVKQEAAQAEAAAQKPAAKPERFKEPVVTRGDIQEVGGEVSGIGKNSISLLTAHDDDKGEETEMVLGLDHKKVNLDHLKSLSALHPGDRVAVRYRAETTDYGDRKETRIRAVTIRFIKPADDTSFYKKASASGAGLVSQGLPLKGVKSDEK
jgi:hypothetical protein